MNKGPDKTPMGPEQKKLFIRRLSVIAIPGGDPDPVGQGAAFLLDQKNFKEGVAESLRWVREVIDTVRKAEGGEVYPPGIEGDEMIAAAILKKADERTKEQIKAAIPRRNDGGN